MEHHLISRGEARKHLGNPVVSVTNLNRRGARAAACNGEHGPIFILAEESAHGHRENVFSVPHADVNNHPIVMSETSPDLGRPIEIDRRGDPLFLDPERGDLQEACRVDTREASVNPISGSTIVVYDPE
jgi:hypothetical protein